MFTLKQRHPAVLVTAGFFFVFLSQLTEPPYLYGLAGIGVILAFWRARQHYLKVLRRLRYVAMAIVVLFAWQTPGIQVLPGLEALSPTYDGFRLAVSPLLRLLTVAAVVACLQEALSLDQWVSSLYLLAKPLALLGLPRERLAIRLRLVLEYVEESTLDWRDFLRGRGPSEVSVVTVSCQLMRASVLDLVLIVLICLVAFGLCVW